MKGNIQEREYDKFRDAQLGRSKVAVTIEQDPANPIPINVNESPELPDGFIGTSLFNQSLSIPSGIESVIISHTVSAQNLVIDKIEVSGSNRATFNVYLDDVLIGVKRTNNLTLETSFDFASLTLATSNKIEVKVIHTRPDAGDFESRIIGVKKL
jgi:hypothetical protein